MSDPLRHSHVIVEYTDPLEHFQGWLVMDGTSHSLCAGGMRVQAGLSRAHVLAMARNMTLKMRICGLPIDGAKCGIDYPPDSPGKLAAMARFMAAIRPQIEARYSMGPDLNTSMAELETIAHDLGIPSVKMAIAKAQGLELSEFQARYALLSQPALGDWSLGRLRAGYGVAMAALATLRALGIPAAGARIAVQGFGNLAKAAIVALQEAQCAIVAIADAATCLGAPPGQQLAVDDLLNQPGTMLPIPPPGHGPSSLPKEAILAQGCDILLLAAVENVITPENADSIQARAVVPGANLAVTSEAEETLFRRGIVVLPSFVAGCGGSLSMNGLFGPRTAPTPPQVLDSIAQAMAAMVDKILRRSAAEAINPTQAALGICAEEPPPLRPHPYACD